MKRAPIEFDELYRIYRQCKAVKTPEDYLNGTLDPGDLYFAWRRRSPQASTVERLFEDTWCFFEYYAPVLLTPMVPLIKKFKTSDFVRLDWNTTARAALKRGASYAVVDQARAVKDPRCLLVEDSQAAIKALAVHHRKQIDTTFVGITGSCGKTSTKELVKAVLSTRHNVGATIGNFNNPLQVQKRLLNIGGKHQYGVMEMAADTFGQIKEDCEVVRPSCGLITCIGKAHLEGFGSLDGVLRAKSELFDYLVSTKGRIFKNLNDPVLATQVNAYPHVTTYGSTPDADVRGEILTSNPTLGVRWYPSKHSSSEYFDVATTLYGAYNLDNILAAIAVGLHFDVPPGQINQALEAYRTVQLRSQVIPYGTNRIILDAYNANPTSMREALETFADTGSELKVAILGDMLELGDVSREEHRRIIAYAGKLGLAEAVFVGPGFTEAKDPNFGRYFLDAKAARRWLAQQEWQNTQILLKASRGIGIERVVEGLVDWRADTQDRS